MSVDFVDNSGKIKMILEQATLSGLEEAAAEVMSQAVQNTPVDTGQLKGAWKYFVDENKFEATIGNTLENAIWTEYGTGEYALENNGRKTPWRYKDAKGKWHSTTGKRPIRMLFNAFSTKKNIVKQIVSRHLKDNLN